MCAFCSVYNHSFKFMTYLVVVTGVYTFLHWLLAVPLLYFHLYECCNQKFPRNWIVWFLSISFASWLGVSILIALIWLCLRLCKARHLNESSVRLSAKLDTAPEGEKTENPKTVHYENNLADSLVKSPEGIKDVKIVFDLPDFSTSENVTVLKVNDHQHNETLVSGLDFPIPLDESQNYVQSESPQPSEKDSETPLKTPREIFFKDLIEAASKSPTYFDFDPEKVSRDLKKKYDLEKLKEEEDGNNFFVGSHTKKENFTSEVMITLNEKDLNVEESDVFGRFQDVETFISCNRCGSSGNGHSIY